MFDLHTHSNFSDGTLPPEKLIEEAKKAGLTLVALTDHDTAAGVWRARAAAQMLRQDFVPGVEMEAEYEDELHILGLGIEPRSHALASLIRLQAQRRDERNERVIELLQRDGMDIREHIGNFGSVTRANLAAAMVKGGYCATIGDAFRYYLKRGQKYYVAQPHPSLEEVLAAIKEAGGISVLAHPMKMKCDHRRLLDALTANGLWGLEAYYGINDDAVRERFSALAEEYGLHPTCGSDFHGANRPEVTLGCPFRDTPELRETEAALRSVLNIGTRRAPSFRRAVSAEEFQSIAERVAAELPEDLYIGLNGGVVISENFKLHKKSQPQRPLYIMGEYHYGGSEGRYITLYYGSFRRVHGHLSAQAMEEEVRRVLLHEFRHHLETRAGEHDLEYEDDDCIAEYLEEEQQRETPSFKTFTTYGDTYDQR
ncbi:MAG: PHP domain-containing protein [Clostridia bacterium]|nr:PHP domain-containing protein [Clostridia bacterium]